MIPGWTAGLVLVLAAYRITRLTGWDDFPPVVWARAVATGEEEVRTGSFNSRAGLTQEPVETLIRHRRPLLAHALHCAFCAGAWWSLAAYLAWLAAGSPGARLDGGWWGYLMTPFAVSAAVGLIARNLDP